MKDINYELKLKEILSFVLYEPDNGNLFLLKNSEKYRRLIPNYEGMLQTTINGVKIKMKYNKFVYFVHTGKLIKDKYTIFHKDLNKNNFEFRNLLVITKEQNFKIIESIKNLKGALKLNMHPYDMFSYVLEYKENGRTKKEVISDITVAKKRLSKLQLKFSKYVCKYVIST
jgi:hypothetical protein